jgi:hypothetical protein
LTELTPHNDFVIAVFGTSVAPGQAHRGRDGGLDSLRWYLPAFVVDTVVGFAVAREDRQ